VNSEKEYQKFCQKFLTFERFQRILIFGINIFDFRKVLKDIFVNIIGHLVIIRIQLAMVDSQQHIIAIFIRVFQNQVGDRGEQACTFFDHLRLALRSQTVIIIEKQEWLGRELVLLPKEHLFEFFDSRYVLVASPDEVVQESQ
jgi:hypothetical protein